MNATLKIHSTNRQRLVSSSSKRTNSLGAVVKQKPEPTDESYLIVLEKRLDGGIQRYFNGLNIHVRLLIFYVHPFPIQLRLELTRYAKLLGW